jgi:NADPH:quinone reductase
VLVYTMGQDAVDSAVADVNAAVAAGDLTELPIHRFTLDQIAAAHDAVQEGAVGKVLIDL